MYLYAFENNNCQKSPYRADKNNIFKKHQKSPQNPYFLNFHSKNCFNFIIHTKKYIIKALFFYI